MNKHSGIAECLLLVGMLMAGREVWAAPESPANQGSGVRADAGNSTVTEVTGESWLNHLNRPFGDTSMGKTGHVGPAPSQSGGASVYSQARGLVGCATQTTTLRGEDLYRINCRGCHGEAGLGAPPEINSVIGPVRAASVTLVMERMKKIGAPMSRAQAAELAQQAEAALVDRLHNGGKDMPPFRQLSEPEIRAILAYLRLLAGVPGAEAEQTSVHESQVRVGELIVKSTCHVCHSAGGPDPTAQQLWDGAIPPLETLTRRKEQSGFIQKVTQGAPVVMGTPATAVRGRMPVFYYLSPDEAADVYLYLSLYPPSELSILNAAAAPLPVSSPAGAKAVATTLGPLPQRSEAADGAAHPVNRGEANYAVMFAGVALLVALLVAGGFAFTVWEFRRLSPGRKLDLTRPVATRVPAVPPASVPATRHVACRTASRRDKSIRAEPSFTNVTSRVRKKKQ